MILCTGSGGVREGPEGELVEEVLLVLLLLLVLLVVLVLHHGPGRR